MIDETKPINLHLSDDDWKFIHKIAPDEKKDNMFIARDWLDLVYRMYMYCVKHPEHKLKSTRIHKKGAEAINKEWGVL